MSYTLHGDYVVETVSTRSDAVSGKPVKSYVVRVKPNTELRAEFSGTRGDRAWAGAFVWDNDDNQLLEHLIRKHGYKNYKTRLKENAHITFRCSVNSLKNDQYVEIKCYASDGGPESVTVEREGSEITTASKDDMEQGNVDSEYLSGWEIPVAVAVIVFGLGSAAAVIGGGRKDENGGGDDEHDKEEPLNENPNLAWRMMKEFGDKLFVGDSPQTIAAKIVQVKNGADIPLDYLTQIIQITSPDCFEVSNVRWLNGFMAADIRVKPGLTMQQLERGGHVNLTLAASGASNTYSMRFDIVCPTLKINDVNVILGDGMVYKTWIQLDSIANPKQLRVLSHSNYEVVEQPMRMDDDWGDQGYFTVQILNKTQKPATNVIEYHDPIQVSVEVELEDGLVVPGNVMIHEYPEGMFFMTEKTTEGYANIQTDNAKNRILFGMDAVVRIPTDMRVYFSKYDAENKMACINYVKQLKVAGDVKGQGKYEEGLSRDFGFTIEDYNGGKFGFTPLTTLAMESNDKPYMAELPLTGVVDYGEYGNDCVEGTLTMALYGLVPYKRTSWDDECDRLLKIITMFELQGDTNVRRTWESRRFYSANELHLFSRALLEEAVQYHTMQSINYNTQAEWLSCGLVCCQVLQYVGDQASEIVLTYYLKSFGKWVANPLRKLVVKLAAEITARYIDGQPLIVNDDYEAMGNTLFEIFNTALSDEIDKWVENPKDWKQAGFLIAAFVGVNTLKHYYLDDDKSNRGDFWVAVCLSCTDMFKESVRATVGKMFGNWLGKIGVNGKKKLSEWLGSSMSADEKLRELVMGKLDDLFGKNQASNAFSTLWDNFPDINENLKSGKNFDYGDFFFKLLVPDKDDDAKLADFVEVAQIVLTVLTYPFEKRINTNVVANTDVRICRERGENETAQSRLEAIQHPY